MSAIRFGPHSLPSQEDPRQAVDLLLERGYDACEIDFEGGFLDAVGVRGAARAARAQAWDRSLDPRADPGLPRPSRAGRKHNMAIGMLDHSAGVAVACGAELVVIHPGFLLKRERADAIAAVVEQLGELRERLAPKGRGVPFGVEVMGRVNELGVLDDVLAIASQLEWVRPVLDFAHMHATSDGVFTSVEPFADALPAADQVIEPGAPFHIHFSDISYANRNEKSHLPYGEGTLRAEPLAEALARFERPATVIGESPDEASNQAIKAALLGERARA